LFAVLYALLAEPLGPIRADIVALAICAIANTAANRRSTFSLRGRAGMSRHYMRGLAASLLPLALNIATLLALGHLGVTSLAVQLLALTAANAIATLAKFMLLRSWVFAR
jgi:putative flippase GtrA